MESEIVVPDKLAVGGPQLGEVLRRTQHLLSTLKVKQAALVKRSLSRSPQRSVRTEIQYFDPHEGKRAAASPTPEPSPARSVRTQIQYLDVSEHSSPGCRQHRSPHGSPHGSSVASPQGSPRGWERQHQTQPSPSLLKLYNLSLHRDDPDEELLQQERQLELLGDRDEINRVESTYTATVTRLRESVDVISLFGDKPPSTAMSTESPGRQTRGRSSSTLLPRNRSCALRNRSNSLQNRPSSRMSSTSPKGSQLGGEPLSYLKVHDTMDLPATQIVAGPVPADEDPNRHTSVSQVPEASPAATPGVRLAANFPTTESQALAEALDLPGGGLPVAPTPIRRLEGRVMGDWVVLGEQYGRSDEVARSVAESDVAYLRMKRHYLRYLANTALGNAPGIPDFDAPSAPPSPAPDGSFELPSGRQDTVAQFDTASNSGESQHSGGSNRTCSTLYTEHERDLSAELVDADQKLADIMARPPRPHIKYDPAAWRKGSTTSWKDKTYLGLFRKWGIFNPPPHHSETLYALTEMKKWAGDGDERSNESMMFQGTVTYQFPTDA